MNGLALTMRLQALTGASADEMALAARGRSPGKPRTPPRWVFAALQIYMAAVVFAGFAPSFYLKPERALAMHPVIHLHAGVMTLWIVFAALQGLLPSQGRLRTHRTLGWWGAALAGLVLVTGVMVTGQGVADGWDPFGLGSPEAFAAIPFRDLVTFSGFFAVGLLTRKRAPEAHRRMMTLATLSVIPAGLARLAAFAPELAIVALNYAPILAMAAWDLYTRRRVLLSTWLGSALLVVATPVCLAMARTQGWQDLVRALT